MTITFSCLQCGQVLSAQAEDAGKEFICPSCQQPLRAPATPAAEDDKGALVWWCLVVLMTIVLPWGMAGNTPVWSWMVLDKLPKTAATVVITEWIVAGVLLVLACILRRLPFSLLHTVLPLVGIVVGLACLHGVAEALGGDVTAVGVVASELVVVIVLAAGSVVLLYVTGHLRLRLGHSRPMAIAQGICAGVCLVLLLLVFCPGVIGFVQRARESSLKEVLWNRAGASGGVLLLSVAFLILASVLAVCHACGAGKQSAGCTLASQQLITVAVAMPLVASVALPCLFAGSAEFALPVVNAVVLVAAMPVLFVAGLARLLVDVVRLFRPPAV